MIKITRGVAPKILKEESVNWLKALQDAIHTYGSYKTIPEKERDKLISHYRHVTIQQELAISTHGKCAFCECHPAEGGFIQVEHFKPKSIYSDLTFDWDNFLPICGQCNTSKSDHDTGIEPILNPYDDNPMQYFEFDQISLKPLPGPAFDIAKLTIEVCGLQSIRLWKPRADILVSLTTFSEAINQALIDYKDADTQRKRDARLRKLRESILTIESLAEPNGKFSAFCKTYLMNCQFYKMAKLVISAP